MSRPGPKPKPSAIRTLEGNPGNLPMNEHEPKPDKVENFEPVDWLDADCEYMTADKFPLSKVSKRVWEILVADLDRLGVLTKIDRGKFARYCESFARWLKMKAFIDKHGEAYPVYGTVYEQEEDELGGQKPRATCKKVLKQMKMFPQVGIYIKLAEALRKYEEEFGIGAASRTRIQSIVRTEFGDEPEEGDDHDFDYASQEGHGVRRVK